MWAKGYKVPAVEDKSELNFLTEFESSLPLSRVDLDDYERRLKKLGTKEDKDFITKPQLIEVFTDHHKMKDIGMEGTIANTLMFNDIFVKEGSPPGMFYVPYLMLLGILYCPSKPTVRARKLYELCQIDLD